ncbi:MAG TPA: hypothetical protein VFC51_05655 [Chloroflexota bacterium]|nr:hypothetical protein [Chloroflexota bacterium]
MEEAIVLLAVTRMLSGFCIAGIDERGTWKRPVKPSGALLLGDVSYRDRTLMRPFDRVFLDLGQPTPDPPHVEDYQCDFVRRRPSLIERLEGDERRQFLADWAEPGPQPLLDLSRSLILFRANRIATAFRLDPDSRRYQVRVRLEGIGDDAGLPCSDLRWRALGRSLLPPSGGVAKLTNARVRERLGAEAIYVALGLARQLNGAYSPLVIGIHGVPDYVPDYDVTVDPARP